MKPSDRNYLGFCQLQRVDPTGLADFQLSQRLLETYPNLSVELFEFNSKLKNTLNWIDL